MAGVPPPWLDPAAVAAADPSLAGGALPPWMPREGEATPPINPVGAPPPWAQPPTPGVPPPWETDAPGAPGAPQTAPPPWMAPKPADEPVVQPQKPVAPPPGPFPSRVDAPRPGPGAAPAQRPPDFASSMVDSAEGQKGAIAAGAQAEAAKAGFVAREGAAAAMDAREQLAQVERDRAQIYGEAKAKTAQLAAEADELGKTKMDTGRWMKSRTTGQKVMIHVGAFLGGMLAARQGRSGNDMIAFLNQEIERDMAAQQQDLATRRGAIDTKQGLLAQELSAGRDYLDALAKGKLAIYGVAKEQILAESGKYDSPVIHARAAEQIAKIDAATAGVLQDYERQKQRDGMDDWKARQANAQGWAGVRNQTRGLDLREREIQNEADARREALAAEERKRADAAKLAGVDAQRKYEADQRERGIYFSSKPGQILGTVATKEGGEKARQVVGDYERAKHKLDRYVALREKYDRSGWLEPTEQTELEQARRDLQLLYKSEAFAHLGVLTGKDLSVLDAVIAAPDGYTTLRDAEGALTNLGKSMDADIDQRLGALGYGGPKVSELYSSSRTQNEKDIPRKIPDEVKRRQAADRDRAMWDAPDSGAQFPEWDIVETHGDKSLTRSGLVVPANAGPIVKAKTYRNDDGSIYGVDYYMENGQVISDRPQQR